MTQADQTPGGGPSQTPDGVAPPPSSMNAIQKVVSRLRWRVRVQNALRYGLLFGALALVVFATTIALTRFRVIDPSAPMVGGAVAIALAAIGLTIGLTRRLDDIRLAASLDAAGHLHSRLGSAIAFSRLPNPSPMQRLAMDDALSVLDRAQPRLASPWLWGTFVVGLVALVLALAITIPTLVLLDPRVPASTAGTLSRLVVPPPMQRTVVLMREDDKKTLETLAEDLVEEQRDATDPIVKDFLAELNELIRALQEGRITPEEAHARLSALDKALEDYKEQAAQQEAMEKQLEEAAKKLTKPEASLAEALEAMRQQALKEAAEALEKLADKVDKKELTKKAEEKLAKDLAELAKNLKTERQKEKERLTKEKDRLKEKEQKEKDRFAKKDKDRLKDVERQLERFDQDNPQTSEAQRELERLSDDLDSAAEDLMRRLSEMMGPMDTPQSEEGPEDVARRERENQQGQEGQEGQEGKEGKEGEGDELSDDELRRAAEALKRMAKRGAGRQQMRAAGGRMVDLKEMLRRAAQQGGEGEDGKESFEQSAQGEGQEGKDGQDGQDGKDGKDGKGGQAGMKPGGKGGDMMLLGGKGQPGAKMPGKGMGGQASDGPGEGIGVGHDPNLMGEKTDMDVKTVDDLVQGKPSDGPTQTRVIMAAAGRGFASRAYADVHQDYAGVVEDNLEKEKIPPGKRTYVRRYFDLIRPR